MRLTLCVCAALALSAAPPPRQFGELPKEPLDKAAELAGKTEKATMWETMGPSIILGGMCLLGTLLLAWMVVGLIKSSGKSLSDTRSFQMLGMVVVLGIGMTILAVGWSGPQIAALSGVLGAALGYLFGRQDRPSEPPTTPPVPPSPT